MLGEIALHRGAGLVSVLTREENTPLLTAWLELIVAPLTRSTFQPGLEWVDVMVIGLDLGQDSGENTLREEENCDKPMPYNMDVLSLLAFNSEKRQNQIMTPHPVEAARLMNGNVVAIESDHLLSARKLARRYGGIASTERHGDLAGC
ncbi:MAG: Bifunctional NAD(P)H-hydrate repair enzyme Nnr [Sodalis sp.]|uniref:NAD(P)H-hydrate dehydratase n=1 Tax=Sodalis sp. (in: enterobacteria) TaxID=1898979 RepID=UPI00387346E6|nr:MAG: Bifunctional NAD(P)H-hydrate repair enzyme Nnr [Sodalis sp.]